MPVCWLDAAAAKSLQSWPTLCDPIDGSPPGSPAPGFLQARTLEWVAISFSNAWKWKVKVKSLSRVRLLGTPWSGSSRLLHPWDFPGESTGVECHCLLHSSTDHCWMTNLPAAEINRWYSIIPWATKFEQVDYIRSLSTLRAKCWQWGREILSWGWRREMINSTHNFRTSSISGDCKVFYFVLVSFASFPLIFLY